MYKVDSLKLILILKVYLTTPVDAELQHIEHQFSISQTCPTHLHTCLLMEFINAHINILVFSNCCCVTVL